MALVALLRGVNVGGHRAFRPAVLAKELTHLGAVNIGAAGTFVFHSPLSRTRLRAELVRRLPFVTEIMICEGREIIKLMSMDLPAPQPASSNIVRFVTVLSAAPRSTVDVPMSLPPSGEWMLRILARAGRYLVGEYRREMKAVDYMGKLDRIFGLPATTRNWNTMTTIVKVLATKPAHR